MILICLFRVVIKSLIRMREATDFNGIDLI
jgi:hypothetical protein